MNMIDVDYYCQSEIVKDYNQSLQIMERRVQDIIAGNARDLLWFLEYDHLYTAGSSASDSDLFSKKIPTYQTNRGGKHTYHGPGQQICYFIIDLNRFFSDKPDLRKYLQILAQINIDLLKIFNINSIFSQQNIGIWIDNKKITSFGIKIKKWVAFHGFAVNINTDLSYYQGIIPCGIHGSQATSIHEILKKKIDMHFIRNQLMLTFKKSFSINKVNIVSKI